jgi:hypothetical protein
MLYDAVAPIILSDKQDGRLTSEGTGRPRVVDRSRAARLAGSSRCRLISHDHGHRRLPLITNRRAGPPTRTGRQPTRCRPMVTLIAQSGTANWLRTMTLQPRPSYSAADARFRARGWLAT